MRIGKRHLIGLISIVFAALAVAPAVQASGTSPDDRPYARDNSVSATRIVSPDDRAYVRGNWVSLPSRIVSPDDRAFSRAIPEPKVLQASAPLQTHGFDWGDAMIGGTFGLALAMLGAGGVVLLMRRRTPLRTS